MPFPGEGVDNSKLTPEYHQGQGEQTTDNNQQPQVDNQQLPTAPQDGQAIDNQGNQQQPTGIQVGEETFESQEDLVQAYNNMKAELETKNNSYKELQRSYTKSRQEIAMRNKMAMPRNNNNIPQQPAINPFMQPPMPMTNPYMNEVQPFYQQPIQQYPQPEQNGQLVNQAMIDMAVERKIMELKASDQNFDEVASELWNIMDSDNYFANIKFTDPDMATNAIGAAYQMAKQKVETAKANIKINNAKQEAYQSKQDKILNNDNSNVAKPNKSQPQKTDADKIKESIIGAKPQRF